MFQKLTQPHATALGQCCLGNRSSTTSYCHALGQCCLGNRSSATSYCHALGQCCLGNRSSLNIHHVPGDWQRSKVIHACLIWLMQNGPYVGLLCLPLPNTLSCQTCLCANRCTCACFITINYLPPHLWWTPLYPYIAKLDLLWNGSMFSNLWYKKPNIGKPPRPGLPWENLSCLWALLDFLIEFLSYHKLGCVDRCCSMILHCWDKTN